MNETTVLRVSELLICDQNVKNILLEKLSLSAKLTGGVGVIDQDGRLGEIVDEIVYLLLGREFSCSESSGDRGETMHYCSTIKKQGARRKKSGKKKRI